MSSMTPLLAGLLATCYVSPRSPRCRLLPLSSRPHTQHQSLSLRHPGAARTGSVASTTSTCGRHGVERWRVGLPAGPPADLCGWRSACQADGHRGVAATRGVTRWPAGRLPWWTSVAGTARAGDKAHARAWRDWRGLACRVVATRPHAPRRSLRSDVVRLVFYCRAVCCRVASKASAPAMAASGPAGEAGGSAALPCVPWQPQAAAGCGGVFLPPQEAQGNPGGATSRAGLAALGAHAHP